MENSADAKRRARGAGYPKGRARVDLQVFLLTALLVVLSCSVVYAINYYLSYQSMVQSLRQRADSIHDYAERWLRSDSFDQLNTREDEKTELYITAKKKLANIREASGVRYLYTAKKNAAGEFIYLVDGLPSDSPDFRYVGDPIEPECIPDLERAMAGQTVMPEKISKTTWGAIFISYFPMHHGEEVIGVLGMEFAADEQARSFQTMAIATTVVILLSCLIAAAIAVLLFRRISNPSYRDMASTDFLTGLKNRNVFERDLYNLNNTADKSQFAILSADMNGLKTVNDTCGHAEGDRYIRLCADILSACLPEGGRLYRIGGDEFVMLLPQAREDAVVRALEEIRRRVRAENENTPYPRGLSLGWARFQEETDGSLADTLKRADAAMYACKQKDK